MIERSLNHIGKLPSRCTGRAAESGQRKHGEQAQLFPFRPILSITLAVC